MNAAVLPRKTAAVSSLAAVILGGLLLLRSSPEPEGADAALADQAMLPGVTVLPEPMTITPAELSFDTGAFAGAGHLVFVEFSSFTCPYCALFARTVVSAIRTDYLHDGSMRYAFVNLPSGRDRVSLRAAAAIECARRKGQFWRLHDWLFQNQRDLTLAAIDRAATRLGADAACIQAQTPSGIDHGGALARRFDITSTPTTLLGTRQPDENISVRIRIRGMQSYGVVRKAVDRLGAAE